MNSGGIPSEYRAAAKGIALGREIFPRLRL